jgi:cation diffusion facilitator CzcD-associated flavoprotein CzcO
VAERTSSTRDLRVAIIGAGPGGMCMAVKLQEAGFSDFVLLERSDGVGGTWRRNTYPGAACDVQSALYSFTFAFKADWTRPYAPQPEILEYMEKVARDFGLLDHCRFGVEVRRVVWQDDSAHWRIELDSGETLTADAVVSAIGMFNELARPQINGLENFGGTMFHSAQWAADHDLTGETVAVIGSAASAVQFVPEIVQSAGQVHLFQRTANWVLPKPDTPYTETELAGFRIDPTPIRQKNMELRKHMDAGMTFADPKVLAETEATGLAAIDVVQDPEVRKKLRPTHPYGCKRPLFSNVYFEAFNRPNLELVTEPISHVTTDGVVTEDGRERKVDTVILATGFVATKYLSALDVVGRHGRHIDEAWHDGAQAYLGVMTAGFPNLFMLYGPNTNNGSILTMIEYQAEHVVGQLSRILDEDLAWIDVLPESMTRYNEVVQEAIAGVRVWQAGCNGYYRTPSGRVVTQWPFSMTEFQRRTTDYDPADFEVLPRKPA